MLVMHVAVGATVGTMYREVVRVSDRRRHVRPHTLTRPRAAVRPLDPAPDIRDSDLCERHLSTTGSRSSRAGRLRGAPQPPARLRLTPNDSNVQRPAIAIHGCHFTGIRMPHTFEGERAHTVLVALSLTVASMRTA